VKLFPTAELLSDAEPRPTAIFVQDSDHPYADHFGRTLAVGNVVGSEQDGVSVPDSDLDLLVGAPDFRDGSNGYDTGRIWIWSGAGRAQWLPNTPASTAEVQILGTHPFERVGRNMHASDVDDDGVHELLLPTRDAGG
jgi:hypothetical protein